VAVGWECGRRRGALVAVELQVFARKGPLPSIRHLLAARGEFFAPGELGAVEPAASGKLPLGFGRQILVRPFCVSQSIAVGDVNHWVIIETAERAARPVGSAPVGAKLERPPLAPVA